MNWKKSIYDSLTSCAALCDEAATNSSRQPDIENYYRFIFLSLDCADLCRQVAMLYVRGSENTRLLAHACIEVCEKCANEAAVLTTEESNRVFAMCQQTIRSCIGLLGMDETMAIDNVKSTPTASSLFYGIDLRETIYN